MVKTKHDTDLLVAESIEDRKRFKTIVSLLYEVEMDNRLCAAMALGKIARIKPDIIKNRWNRIFYAFDDTMSCWGAAEALGEIGRNMPELRGKILLLLRKFEKDDVSCQGYIWAICRIAQVDMARVKEFLPDIIRFINEKEICLKAQAIWAAGELRIHDALEGLEKCLGDLREVQIYTNNSVETTTIDTLAKESIAKIKEHRAYPYKGVTR
jgi:hypothetical protein